MKDLELYMYEGELWCLYSDGRNERVTERSTELISQLLDEISELYPEAYEDLSGWFAKSSRNVPYYRYLIASQFCRCNFGKLDSARKDIDRRWNFNFERVECPLRGRCTHENRVCNPMFNSRMSEAEARVMKMVYEGYGNDEIAESLYLSPHTVKNHIKRVYLKLGIHEKAEFIRYAKDNNLFKD